MVRDESEARKLVRENLRRRATAKRRIGVEYRFRQLIDPGKCCPGTNIFKPRCILSGRRPCVGA